MTEVPGWYPDPFTPHQLRWWDGAWSTHIEVPRSSAMATGAMTLGIAAFVLIYFPIFGLLLAICATVMAIGAVRQDRDDTFAVSVLSISAFVLSLDVFAFAWSVWIGLYGIVISPSPA